MAPSRQLVSVRTITKVERIRGHRGMELITVGGGWTVVVPRGDYAEGEHVVYFEIDSFIPETDRRLPEGSVLTTYKGRKGHHVRSNVIKGQVSQGMVFALSSFPEILSVLDAIQGQEKTREEAVEIIKTMAFQVMLGVLKWEVSNDLQGTSLGLPPTFFPQPGCKRVQNVPQVFYDENNKSEFQVTEKLDGLSMSVYRVDRDSKWHLALPKLPEGHPAETAEARIGVCSQTVDYDARSNELFWAIAQQDRITEKIHQLGINNVVIQGELVGHIINDNSMDYPEGEHEFWVFDIFDIDKSRYLVPLEVERLCRKHDIRHVPIIGYSRLWDFAPGMDELLAKAEGVGCRGQSREGFVFKSCTKNHDFAFKVISNAWLLGRKQ